MRFRPTLLLLVLSGGVFAAQSAWGHPGHGTTDPDSIAHVAEPVHAGPIVGLVVAAAVASAVTWKMARKRR